MGLVVMSFLIASLWNTDARNRTGGIEHPPGRHDPRHGPVDGVSTLAGQNIGAGNIDRAGTSTAGGLGRFWSSRPSA